MAFPVDILKSVDHESLELAADEYMSQFPYRKPEYLNLPDSKPIEIGLCNVSFVPLYGAETERKLLALLSPDDCVTGLYLLDRWWGVKDVLKTAEPSRTGLIKVNTLGERIVLYVLNRIVLRNEKSTKDVSFLCHCEHETAKILWKDGEAIGFYSFKPKGSLCRNFLTQCYQLPVMDTVFVRKCHRGKGHGVKILEDFVGSFTKEDIGLKFPLSEAMYKVCEKYLSVNPADKELLWEVEKIGSPFQRTLIAKRLQMLKLKENDQVVSKLNFEEDVATPPMEIEITKIQETTGYTVEIMEETITNITKEADDIPVTRRGRSSNLKRRGIRENSEERLSMNIIRVEDIEAGVKSPNDVANEENLDTRISVKESEAVLKSTTDPVTAAVTNILELGGSQKEEEQRFEKYIIIATPEKTSVSNLTSTEEIKSQRASQEDSEMVSKEQTVELQETTVGTIDLSQLQTVVDVEIVKMSTETEEEQNENIEAEGDEITQMLGEPERERDVSETIEGYVNTEACEEVTEQPEVHAKPIEQEQAHLHVEITEKKERADEIIKECGTDLIAEYRNDNIDNANDTGQVQSVEVKDHSETKAHFVDSVTEVLCTEEHLGEVEPNQSQKNKETVIDKAKEENIIHDEEEQVFARNKLPQKRTSALTPSRRSKRLRHDPTEKDLKTTKSVKTVMDEDSEQPRNEPEYDMSEVMENASVENKAEAVVEDKDPLTMETVATMDFEITQVEETIDVVPEVSELVGRAEIDQDEEHQQSNVEPAEVQMHEETVESSTMTLSEAKVVLVDLYEHSSKEGGDIAEQEHTVSFEQQTAETKLRTEENLERDEGIEEESKMANTTVNETAAVEPGSSELQKATETDDTERQPQNTEGTKDDTQLADVEPDDITKIEVEEIKKMENKETNLPRESDSDMDISLEKDVQEKEAPVSSERTLRRRTVRVQSPPRRKSRRLQKLETEADVEHMESNIDKTEIMSVTEEKVEEMDQEVNKTEIDEANLAELESVEESEIHIHGYDKTSSTTEKTVNVCIPVTTSDICLESVDEIETPEVLSPSQTEQQLELNVADKSEKELCNLELDVDEKQKLQTQEETEKNEVEKIEKENIVQEQKNIDEQDMPFEEQIPTEVESEDEGEIIEEEASASTERSLRHRTIKVQSSPRRKSRRVQKQEAEAFEDKTGKVRITGKGVEEIHKEGSEIDHKETAPQALTVDATENVIPAEPKEVEAEEVELHEHEIEPQVKEIPIQIDLVGSKDDISVVEETVNVCIPIITEETSLETFNAMQNTNDKETRAVEPETSELLMSVEDSPPKEAEPEKNNGTQVKQLQKALVVLVDISKHAQNTEEETNPLDVLIHSQTEESLELEKPVNSELQPCSLTSEEEKQQEHVQEEEDTENTPDEDKMEEGNAVAEDDLQVEDTETNESDHEGITRRSLRLSAKSVTSTQKTRKSARLHKAELESVKEATLSRNQYKESTVTSEDTVSVCIPIITVETSLESIDETVNTNEPETYEQLIGVEIDDKGVGPHTVEDIPLEKAEPEEEVEKDEGSSVIQLQKATVVLVDLNKLSQNTEGESDTLEINPQTEENLELDKPVNSEHQPCSLTSEEKEQQDNLQKEEDTEKTPDEDNMEEGKSVEEQNELDKQEVTFEGLKPTEDLEGQNDLIQTENVEDTVTSGEHSETVTMAEKTTIIREAEKDVALKEKQMDSDIKMSGLAQESSEAVQEILEEEPPVSTERSLRRRTIQVQSTPKRKSRKRGQKQQAKAFEDKTGQVPITGKRVKEMHEQGEIAEIEKHMEMDDVPVVNKEQTCSIEETTIQGEEEVPQIESSEINENKSERITRRGLRSGTQTGTSQTTIKSTHLHKTDLERGKEGNLSRTEETSSTIAEAVNVCVPIITEETNVENLNKNEGVISVSQKEKTASDEQKMTNDKGKMDKALADRYTDNEEDETESSSESLMKIDKKQTAVEDGVQDEEKTEPQQENTLDKGEDEISPVEKETTQQEVVPLQENVGETNEMNEFKTPAVEGKVALESSDQEVSFIARRSLRSRTVTVQSTPRKKSKRLHRQEVESGKETKGNIWGDEDDPTILQSSVDLNILIQKENEALNTEDTAELELNLETKKQEDIIQVNTEEKAEETGAKDTTVEEGNEIMESKSASLENIEQKETLEKEDVQEHEEEEVRNVQEEESPLQKRENEGAPVNSSAVERRSLRKRTTVEAAAQTKSKRLRKQEQDEDNEQIKAVMGQTESVEVTFAEGNVEPRLDCPAEVIMGEEIRQENEEGTKSDFDILENKENDAAESQEEQKDNTIQMKEDNEEEDNKKAQGRDEKEEVIEQHVEKDGQDLETSANECFTLELEAEETSDQEENKADEESNLAIEATKEPEEGEENIFDDDEKGLAIETHGSATDSTRRKSTRQIHESKKKTKEDESDSEESEVQQRAKQKYQRKRKAITDLTPSRRSRRHLRAKMVYQI